MSARRTTKPMGAASRQRHLRRLQAGCSDVPHVPSRGQKQATQKREQMTSPLSKSAFTPPLALPRFPQPFLDLLALYSPWRDVLSLVSVDKREAPMRHCWINDTGLVNVHLVRCQADLRLFRACFPRCVVLQKVLDGSDVSPHATRVTLCDEFDEPLANLVLPPHVTHLTLGAMFGWLCHSPFGGALLPSSLTHLTFGCNFDRPLSLLVLPPSQIGRAHV